MAHEECKIYFDGSHYIAIPKTSRPNFRRLRPPEELIVVDGEGTATVEGKEAGAEQKAAEPRRVTRKEYFEELHDESLGGPEAVRQALGYITKYMEKTGEKMVYSKGLSQYFISDILDHDVASPYGVDDRKLLLFDDFSCFDEGVYMGEVSPEVISQMRKSN